MRAVRLEFVHPVEAPLVKDRSGGPPPACHLLTLYWDGRREAILCQLALFNYQVRLCRDFRGLWRELLRGHLCDVEKREGAGAAEDADRPAIRTFVLSSRTAVKGR